jgi:hypothetical protein
MVSKYEAIIIRANYGSVEEFVGGQSRASFKVRQYVAVLWREKLRSSRICDLQGSKFG